MTKVLVLGGMREVHRIMKRSGYTSRLAEMQRFISKVDGSVSGPLPTSSRAMGDEPKGSVSCLRTPMMLALDPPDGLVLENMKFLLQSESLPQAPNALWLPGARSRILKAAIVAGTVETQWAIPDCFTFIQDIIADREPRLGESEQFNPNITFAPSGGHVMLGTAVARDHDSDEGDEGVEDWVADEQ